MSKEMFEKTDDIKMENFDNKDNKKIKLNNTNNLILKKCLIDELGFSNLRTNGFMPVYNYYKKDNKLIVRVEAPGNCDFSANVEMEGEYTYIRIKGNKKKDREPENIKDNIYINREIGEFSLDIPLKSSEYNIKNEKPEIKEGKGVFIITYIIDEVKTSAEYKQKEEEEI